MTVDDRLFDVLEKFFFSCVGMGESESMNQLVELDLSISQAKTIFALSQAAGPMPISSLAELIHLSVAATGRNVDQLVKADLVERRESEVDRRVKLVEITKAGRAVVDQHLEAKRSSLRALVARLDQAEATRLYDALCPIVAGISLRPIQQETSQ